MYMHACIHRSAQQEAVLKNMLSEGDYKCLYNTRNRAFTVGKMLGAVYRYWYVCKRDVLDYVCVYITVGKMLGAVYRYWYVYKRDT